MRRATDLVEWRQWQSSLDWDTYNTVEVALEKILVTRAAFADTDDARITSLLARGNAALDRLMIVARGTEVAP